MKKKESKKLKKFIKKNKIKKRSKKALILLNLIELNSEKFNINKEGEDYKEARVFIDDMSMTVEYFKAFFMFLNKEG